MFDHEKLKVYFRGEFVDFSQATVSISNAGFIYGLGVFTGMRAFFNSEKKKLFVFRPDLHFKRLEFSCKVFRYKNFLEKYDYVAFLEMVKTLLKINNITQDAYIRITNFSDENKVTAKFFYHDTLCAYLYPLGDYVPTNGMKCKVSSWVRVHDNAIPARTKACGLYVNTALAKSEVLMEGYDEAIFLDERGNAVEGSAENLFILKNDRLITPPVQDTILEGITRGSIIELARDLGIAVEERSISRSELYGAQEIFLTGTGAKVSPVIELDKYKVGDGSVGPVSKQLQDLYLSVARGEQEKYLHWVEAV